MLAGLAFAAPITAVAATTASAAPTNAPNRFSVGGWNVAWRDYVHVFNQAIEVGFWYAVRDGEPHAWASTTLGTCEKYGELWQIDTTITPNGIPITPFSSDEDRQRGRDGALSRLLVSLKTGRTWE